MVACLCGLVMYYLRQPVTSCLAVCWVTKQRYYLPSLFSSQHVVTVVIFAWRAVWRASLEMMLLVSLARWALLGLIFFVA